MIVRNKVWERPLQLVCPLEIRSTLSTEELNKRIKIANKVEIDKADEDQERSRRKAGDKAKKRIKDLAADDD